MRRHASLGRCAVRGRAGCGAALGVGAAACSDFRRQGARRGMACSSHCSPRRARARNGHGTARRGVRPLGARQAAARRGADRIQHIARPRAGADLACARGHRGRRSGTGARRSRARAAPRAHRDCGGGAESRRAARGRCGRALSAGLGAAGGLAKAEGDGVGRLPHRAGISGDSSSRGRGFRARLDRILAETRGGRGPATLRWRRRVRGGRFGLGAGNSGRFSSCPRAKARLRRCSLERGGVCR